MAVELDVGDLLDVAIRRQHALVVLPAEVDLSEPRLDPDLEAVRVADDRGGLLRAPQVARIDRRDRLAGECGCEVGRLAPSELVQRRVGVTLPAAGAIPVGLAVSDED